MNTLKSTSRRQLQFCEESGKDRYIASCNICIFTIHGGQTVAQTQASYPGADHDISIYLFNFSNCLI